MQQSSKEISRVRTSLHYWTMYKRVGDLPFRIVVLDMVETSGDSGGRAAFKRLSL